MDDVNDVVSGALGGTLAGGSGAAATGPMRRGDDDGGEGGVGGGNPPPPGTGTGGGGGISLKEAPTNVWYAEKTLAEVLGVPVDRLRATRRKGLEKGRDFALVTGGEPAGRWMAYSEAGLAALGAALGLEGDVAAARELCRIVVTGVVDSAPKKKAPPAVREEVRVVRTEVPNVHLVLCERGDGQRVYVRVKDRKNLTRGMMLFAEKRAGVGVWVHCGPLPRRRGKF